MEDIIVTCISDYRRSLDWWIDLLTTYRSLLQIIITLRIVDLHTPEHSTLDLLSPLSQSLLGNTSQRWLFLCKVFSRRFLVTNLSDVDSSGSVVHWLALHSWTLNSTTELNYWTELPIIFRLSLYRLGTDLTENMCHVSECVFIGPLPSTGYGADHIENTSSVRMRASWPVAQHWVWRGAHRKHFFRYLFYCCVHVFPVLPRNGTIRHTITD
jgi:hypothetical protein